MPAHAFGQFFHFQCMQSIDPSIPGQPSLSLSLRILLRSCSVGSRKNLSPYYCSIIAAQKQSKISNIVDSAIRDRSSTSSLEHPVANNLIAVIIFCLGDIPSIPVASTRCVKTIVGCQPTFDLEIERLLHPKASFKKI